MGADAQALLGDLASLQVSTKALFAVRQPERTRMWPALDSAIDEGAQALIVEGAFAQWRIFGTAIDLLAGRPNNVDDWSRQITDWPAKDDTTRLTLGAI